VCGNCTGIPKSTQFPRVTGCTDGSHIAVKTHAADRDNYVNRKGYPSINLLAVCDHRLKFWFTFSDCSVHDARVLQESVLCDPLADNQLYDSQQFHLLGDVAYSLLPSLLVSFRDNGHLTPQQISCNTTHSSARCSGEGLRTHERQIWRLKDLDVTCTDYGPLVIETCIILHNIGLSDEFDETNAHVDDCPDESQPDVSKNPTMKEHEAKRRSSRSTCQEGQHNLTQSVSGESDSEEVNQAHLLAASHQDVTETDEVLRKDVSDTACVLYVNCICE